MSGEQVIIALMGVGTLIIGVGTAVDAWRRRRNATPLLVVTHVSCGVCGRRLSPAPEPWDGCSHCLGWME